MKAIHEIEHVVWSPNLVHNSYSAEISGAQGAVPHQHLHQDDRRAAGLWELCGAPWVGHRGQWGGNSWLALVADVVARDWLHVLPSDWWNPARPSQLLYTLTLAQYYLWCLITKYLCFHILTSFLSKKSTLSIVATFTK